MKRKDLVVGREYLYTTTARWREARNVEKVTVLAVEPWRETKTWGIVREVEHVLPSGRKVTTSARPCLPGSEGGVLVEGPRYVTASQVFVVPLAHLRGEWATAHAEQQAALAEIQHLAEVERLTTEQRRAATGRVIARARAVGCDGPLHSTAGGAQITVTYEDLDHLVTLAEAARGGVS